VKTQALLEKLPPAFTVIDSLRGAYESPAQTQLSAMRHKQEYRATAGRPGGNASATAIFVFGHSYFHPFLSLDKITSSHGSEYEDGWLSSGLLRRVDW
jgi:hypothetical protein